jgi:hypothetical protein
MSDNNDGAGFDNESEGSAESESWLAEQVRLITLEDGLA